jgi:hypothetical protein
LTPLFAICGGAELALQVAGQNLRSGQFGKAREHAARSWKLRHTSEAARLAFLACIGLNDFASIRLWRSRAVGEASKEQA